MTKIFDCMDNLIPLMNIIPYLMDSIKKMKSWIFNSVLISLFDWYSYCKPYLFADAMFRKKNCHAVVEFMNH